MRDIKFRAWDTETKEMSYDYLNKNWLRVCIESPYVELMQYTGLKDKNGKEIYEGDRYRKGNDVGTVVFERGSFWINWNQPFTWGIERDLYRVFDEGEVIGNIYANPIKV